MGSVPAASNSGVVTETSNPQELENFQAEAVAHIRAVQQSLCAMLEATGQRVLKTRDVQKQFGMDPRLSWQVYKLLNANELLSAAQYVPPGVSFLKLTNAARGKGVNESLIAAAQQAFECFEAFVELHAGDRARLESMVSMPGKGQEAYQAAVQHRKAIFRGHAFFWGVEVRVMYGVNMIGPSQTYPGKSDVVYVVNQTEFNRLRPNVNTHVAGLHFRRTERGDIQGEALDPEALARHGAPILPAFSKGAIPHLVTYIDQGVNWVRLAGKAVGLTNGVDMAFGEVGRGMPIDLNNELTCSIIRPTQQLYLEMLMHRGIFPAMNMAVSNYGHVSFQALAAGPENPDWKLPCYESAVHLRRADDKNIPDIPHRQELLEYTCAKMGWVLEDFDVYRLHVEYPMLDTATVLRLTAGG